MKLQARTCASSARRLRYNRPRNFQRLSVNFTRTIAISSDVKVTFLEEQWVGEEGGYPDLQNSCIDESLGKKDQNILSAKNTFWQDERSLTERIFQGSNLSNADFCE